MRMYRDNNGYTKPVSNEQFAVIRLVREYGEVDKHKFSLHQQYLAHQLVIENILKTIVKDNKIYYVI